MFFYCDKYFHFVIKWFCRCRVATNRAAKCGWWSECVQWWHRTTSPGFKCWTTTPCRLSITATQKKPCTMSKSSRPSWQVPVWLSMSSSTIPKIKRQGCDFYYRFWSKWLPPDCHQSSAIPPWSMCATIQGPSIPSEVDSTIFEKGGPWGETISPSEYHVIWPLHAHFEVMFDIF